MSEDWKDYVYLTGSTSTLTGVRGGIEFKDGKSVKKVFSDKVEALAACQLVFREVDGERIQVGKAAELIRQKLKQKELKDGRNEKLSSSTRTDSEHEASGSGQHQRVQRESEPQGNRGNTESSVGSGQAEQPTSVQVVLTDELTHDNLAAVMDKKGIRGLREFADPLNIKGSSGAALIDSLVNYQEAKDAAANKEAEEALRRVDE